MTTLRLYWAEIDLSDGSVLRPIADVTTTGWTDQIGGTTNLYSVLDESPPSDADYAQYENPSGSNPLVISLEAGVDPVIHTGHKLRYRIGGQSGAVDWTVRLLQNTTEIASWLHTDITTVQTFEQILTEGEAASITNYAALRVEFDPSV